MIVRAIDAVFRFLASVKLAVICLGTLSVTLAFATWFNSCPRDVGGDRVDLLGPLVRRPPGLPGDEHPLRGVDPLPLGQAADRAS